jgi:hypothetical protein
MRQLTILRGKYAGPFSKENSSSLFLNGQWLKQWGFEPGDRVTVTRNASGAIEIQKFVPTAPGFHQAPPSPDTDQKHTG